jgi:hypothetical protein
MDKTCNMKRLDEKCAQNFMCMKSLGRIWEYNIKTDFEDMDHILWKILVPHGAQNDSTYSVNISFSHKEDSGKF